jgi:hypothetical protein
MKILLSIIWVILILFGINLFVDISNRYVVHNLPYFYPLFIGIAVYAITLAIIPYRKYQFLNTFFHEMSHLIFAIITFGKPRKLVITNATSGTGGYVSYASSPFLKSIHNHIVALAPYFFIPLTLIFSLLIYYNQPHVWYSWIYPSGNLNIYLFLVGFSYTYHLTMIITQARPNQTDFNAVGYKYGLLFSFVMHLFLLILVLAFITSKFGSIEYLKSYPYTKEFVSSGKVIYNTTQELILKINEAFKSIKN